VSHHQYSYHLYVAAEADSTFLARVCGALASLGLIPESFHSRRNGHSSHRTRLAIVLSDATPRQVDLLERKLLQMTQVVGLQRKRRPANAALPVEN
jgi:acetolactate synthase small subunit